MATALKLRRGTTSAHSTFTGAEGEITVDTTKDTVVVHDGSTVGGFPLAKEAGVVTQTSATGSARVPNGTTAERDGSPSTGFFRFNTTLGKAEIYTGSAWGSVGGCASGGGTDEVFLENGQTVTTNYTLTTGKNAVSAGPITINSGVTVTIPSGATWVIV
jgi:hypothetical protein